MAGENEANRTERPDQEVKVKLPGGARRVSAEDAAAIHRLIEDARTKHPDRALRDLAGVEDTPHRQEIAEQSDTERALRHESDELQQDKIIAAVVAGASSEDPDARANIQKYVLRQDTVSLAPGDKERYFQMVREGKVDGNQVIENTRKPDDSPEALQTRFEGMNDQMKGIIAHFELDDFAKHAELSPDDLKTFLGKVDAVSFDQLREKFLTLIEQNNKPGKREVYEKAFEQVGQVMFGRQWEYLKQMKELEKQAGPKNVQGSQREQQHVRSDQIPQQGHVSEHAPAGKKKRDIKGTVANGLRIGGKAFLSFVKQAIGGDPLK
jgi:hypothetical protein